MHKKNIVIIPARGGSKRLKNKNILNLGGDPLIAHSIRYGTQNLKYIDEIYVSTDSEEIANISKEYGASVLERPANLSGDYAKTSDVIKYHTQKLNETGLNIKWVVTLQPTNPLRPEWLLEKAIQEMENSSRKSLASFSSFKKKYGFIKEGKFYPENYKFGQRSQDIINMYYENGLIYITHFDLIKKGVLMSEDLYPFIINSIHSTVDIDDKNDFDYAEIVYNYLMK